MRDNNKKKVEIVIQTRYLGGGAKCFNLFYFVKEIKKTTELQVVNSEVWGTNSELRDRNTELRDVHSKLQENRILNSVLIDKTKELAYFKSWLCEQKINISLIFV